MDKRKDFTGINPDIRLDQILIDPEAHRPAIHALMKSFAVGTNPNFIISGCVVSVGGVAPTNTWSLTAGYIYLNDEVTQVDSQSGTFDSGTEFLAFSKSTTYDSKGDITYNDGTPRQTWQVNRGIITVQGSVLVTELDAINGDNIDDKIKAYLGASSETNAGVIELATEVETTTGTDAERAVVPATLAAVTGKIRRKYLSIGIWNMDSTSTVSINHGLSLSNIIGLSAIIIDDTGQGRDSIEGVEAGGLAGGNISAGSLNITLERATSGRFDNATYDDGTINRGYIIIDYL